METRELFERLVVDEPPLTISASVASAAGRRTERRRYAGAASLLVAVVVVGSGVFVQSQQGTRSPGAGTTASPSPVVSSSAKPTSGVPSLPFLSADQISHSNARVYGLLVAYAGGAAQVAQGSPLWDTAPITDKTVFVATQVEYRSGSGTGLLRVVTNTARDAKTRYAGLLDGNLCTEANGGGGHGGSFFQCVARDLSGGGRLYTYSRREAQTGQVTNREASSTLGPGVYERDAIVVAGDGSALSLVFQVLSGDNVNAPIPLTDLVQPSPESLGGLALDAAATWQPHDADVGAPGASSHAAGSSPALTGVPSFAFTSAAQVSDAQARAYGELVAAGEAEGPLTAENPPALVTAVPPVVQAQVKLALTTTNVFVALEVASTKAAPAVYGTALSEGPCTGAVPNRAAAARCKSTALPGGGTLWTSEVEQPSLPQVGLVTPSTTKEVMQRNALVVAADGSALEIMEFAELPDDGDDIKLPSQGSLDIPAVTALAENAAAAWAKAAG
jgi:hypothetical protein